VLTLQAGKDAANISKRDACACHADKEKAKEEWRPSLNNKLESPTLMCRGFSFLHTFATL